MKHIKTNFEDAERTDLVLEKAYCALQVHTQQKTLQTTAGGGNEQQIVLHGTTSEDVENHDSNALVTLTALISHLDSNNEDTASEAAHQLFLKRHLAIVLYEDIHRRAVSFATSTLHQRQHPGLSRETDRETSEPRRFLEPEDGFRASPPPPPGLKQSLDREFMTVPLDDPFGGTANRLDPYRQDYLRSTRRPVRNTWVEAHRPFIMAHLIWITPIIILLILTGASEVWTGRLRLPIQRDEIRMGVGRTDRGTGGAVQSLLLSNRQTHRGIGLTTRITLMEVSIAPSMSLLRI